LSPSPKHFLRDYSTLVSRLRERHGKAFWSKPVMGIAVGGEFDAVGQIQADLLRMHGLRDGMSLLDVACGAGRTAFALSNNFRLGAYLGTDVVADLLEFARELCPQDYRFQQVDGLHVPAGDASFDMACAFSLFTHLLHEESYVYLGEILRVLKPGGLLVFSFLEFAMAHHWNIFEITAQQAAEGSRAHLNVFLERSAIETFASHLGCSIACYQDDLAGPYIPLSRPLEYDDGSRQEGLAAFGQTVCVLRKRAA